MIRFARPEDAGQLCALNAVFNGEGLTTPEEIAASLAENRQELVVVAEAEGALQGFVCVQIKRSACYPRPTAEIAEVYVYPQARGKGLAAEMLRFAETHCADKLGICEFTVLTGQENAPALALYRSRGFVPEEETLLRKEL